MSTAPRNARLLFTRNAASDMFRAFRIRNYRIFWIAQLVSLTGSWMQRVAQAWLVLQISDSPLALGLVTTLQFTPILLLSLFGGVIADRFPKYRLMIVTQAIQMALAAVLAVLASSGQIQLWHIYTLAVLLGLTTAFDAPSRQALIVELVGPDDLANAVALTSMQFNGTRIFGPALAGVVIAAFGVATCFWVNALSYIAVIGGLLAMRPSEFFEQAIQRADACSAPRRTGPRRSHA